MQPPAVDQAETYKSVELTPAKGPFQGPPLSKLASTSPTGLVWDVSYSRGSGIVHWMA